MTFDHPLVFSRRFALHVLLQTLALTIWLYLCGTIWLEEKRLTLWLTAMGGSGLVATLTQLLFLPQWLRHERLDWLGYGILGSLTGTALLYAAVWYADNLTGATLYGLALGIIQWSILRDTPRKTWKWMIASPLGYLILGVVFMIARSAFVLASPTDYEWGVFAIGCAVAALLQTVTTLWTLERL
ncbi:MAG: hypothetical protein ACOYLB_15785 [Phototrophicaceae bacterium]